MFGRQSRKEQVENGERRKAFVSSLPQSPVDEDIDVGETYTTSVRRQNAEKKIFLDKNRSRRPPVIEFVLPNNVPANHAFIQWQAIRIGELRARIAGLEADKHELKMRVNDLEAEVEDVVTQKLLTGPEADKDKTDKVETEGKTEEEDATKEKPTTGESS